MVVKVPGCDGAGPPARACHGPEQGVVIRATKRHAFLLALVTLLAACVFAATASSSPVGTKRAQARQVLAEIQSIDSNLEKVVEAYNASQIKLNAIEAEQKVNERRLEIARSNYQRAQSFLQSGFPVEQANMFSALYRWSILKNGSARACSVSCGDNCGARCTVSGR